MNQEAISNQDKKSAREYGIGVSRIINNQQEAMQKIISKLSPFPEKDIPF